MGVWNYPPEIFSHFPVQRHLARFVPCLQRFASGVRRARAALFQSVQVPPGERCSLAQPERLWR